MDEEDKQLLEKNKHISTETIIQDIKDTQVEINQNKRRIDELTSQTVKRQEFINKLYRIIALRD